MPASYVHQSVAAHAADALSLFTSDAERSALLAGAEGPDPMFFCFRPGKPFAPVVASLLHTQKTDDFLLALCDVCARTAAAFSRIMRRIPHSIHSSTPIL